MVLAEIAEKTGTIRVSISSGLLSLVQLKNLRIEITKGRIVKTYHINSSSESNYLNGYHLIKCIHEHQFARQEEMVIEHADVLWAIEQRILKKTFWPVFTLYKSNKNLPFHPAGLKRSIVLSDDSTAPAKARFLFGMHPNKTASIKLAAQELIYLAPATLQVKGDINSRVILNSHVKGNIEAGIFSMGPKGQLEGELTTNIVSLADRATLDAKVNMGLSLNSKDD